MEDWLKVESSEYDEMTTKERYNVIDNDIDSFFNNSLGDADMDFISDNRKKIINSIIKQLS